MAIRHVGAGFLPGLGRILQITWLRRRRWKILYAYERAYFGLSHILSIDNTLAETFVDKVGIKQSHKS
jgi:hypothetical protein